MVQTWVAGSAQALTQPTHLPTHHWFSFNFFFPSFPGKERERRRDEVRVGCFGGSGEGGVFSKPSILADPCLQILTQIPSAARICISHNHLGPQINRLLLQAASRSSGRVFALAALPCLALFVTTYRHHHVCFNIYL